MRIDKLDVLFSEYIRKRAIAEDGGCQRCLSPKYDIVKDNGDTFPAWRQLQCSHFMGRSKRSVRLDADNAVGLCGACHIYFTAHPLEHIEFFKQRLGEQFDMLQHRARILEKIDREAIKLYLQEKIRGVESES